MLPQYINKLNEGLLRLTDTSLYSYIRVKHFGMASIKLVVLLTVVNPSNSYYTQRGWHT